MPYPARAVAGFGEAASHQEQVKIEPTFGMGLDINHQPQWLDQRRIFHTAYSPDRQLPACDQHRTEPRIPCAQAHPSRGLVQCIVGGCGHVLDRPQATICTLSNLWRILLKRVTCLCGRLVFQLKRVDIRGLNHSQDGTGITESSRFELNL